MKLRKKAAMGISLGTLALLVIAALFIWIMGGQVMGWISGWFSSATGCSGDCLSSCDPELYRRDWAGDVWCKENEGAAQCCIPLRTAAGTVPSSAVKLYYNGDRGNPLRSGESVSLTPLTDELGVRGTFEVGFTPDIKDAFCYGQISLEDGRVYPVAMSNLFKTKTTQSLLQEGTLKLYEPHKEIDNEQDTCKASIQAMNGGKLTSPKMSVIVGGDQYLNHMGERLRYEIVVIDRESCEKYENDDAWYFDTCDPLVHTVNVRIPERKPAIALTIDGQEVQPDRPYDLERGTHNIEVRYRQPYSQCVQKPLHDSHPMEDPGNMVRFSKDFMGEQNCLATNPNSFIKKGTLTITEQAPGGLPFGIKAVTLSDQLQLGQEYELRVAQDDRLQVNGPAPGLTKEKNIEITCRNAACSNFRYALLTNPWQCVPNNGGQQMRGMENYGGEDSGRWLWTVDDEQYNGRYLCVFAESNDEQLASVGLWQGEPTRFAIDATEPQLGLKYNSWEQELAMFCKDTGSDSEYVSGCKSQPYSYTYITDPLKFLTYVGSGGLLKNTFNECPEPEKSQYVPWRRDESVMPFRGGDVRVICVKAEDAAGNHVVESKLIYSSMEMLAMLLQQYAQQQAEDNYG